MTFLKRLKELGSTISRSDQLKTKVASDLSVLIALAELKRKDVAKRLNTSEAALSIKLNGTANLTLESICSITEAVGYDVDVVFRKRDSQRTCSFFELQQPQGDAELATMKIPRHSQDNWRVPKFDQRVTVPYSQTFEHGSIGVGGDVVKFAPHA